jgi:hypothetical protein
LWYIENNPIKSLYFLAALAVAQMLSIFYLNFWFAFGFVFILYFSLSLYIFVLIEPLEWEAGILFLPYLLASLVLLLIFASISYRNPETLTFVGGNDDSVKIIPRRFEEHFYYAASMVTSLGFSSYLPLSSEVAWKRRVEKASPFSTLRNANASAEWAGVMT